MFFKKLRRWEKSIVHAMQFIALEKKRKRAKNDSLGMYTLAKRSACTRSSPQRRYLHKVYMVIIERV